MSNPAGPSKAQAAKNRPVKRSPRYPALDLAQALVESRLVYNREGRNRIPGASVVRPLGYSGLNGAAKRVLAALRQYGLIERRGADRYALSEDTIAVLRLAADDRKRLAAIERLAVKPAVFSLLHQEYGWRLPRASVLRPFLARRGFQPAAIDHIIKNYQETLNFAGIRDTMGEVGDGAAESSAPILLPSSDIPAVQPGNSSMSAALHADPKKVVTYRVPVGQGEVAVSFVGTVTKPTISRLIKHLELIRDDYPEEDR